MTLIVCCFVPNGIAVSGDSRTTGTRAVQAPQPTPGNPNATVAVHTPWILSDSARKVFIIHDRFAVATWGEAFLHNMPIAHHVTEFSTANPLGPSTTVEQIADALMAYFRGMNPSLNTGFVVAGYDATLPFVFELGIASSHKKRWNVDPATGQPGYAVFYGGEWDIIGRLMSNPANNPPFNLLNLQDAVDLSRHLIRTAIDQMRFEPRFPTVGGHIDTITLTPARTKFLVRKELHT